MPSMLMTENFGDILDPRFSKIFDKAYKERISASMIPMIFGMKSSTRNYEMMSGIGGLGDVQDFDGTISYDAFSQLYDSTVTFPEKALGIKAERKLVDDELFGILDARPWQLAEVRCQKPGETGRSGVCQCVHRCFRWRRCGPLLKLMAYMESQAEHLPVSHKAWAWFEANKKPTLYGVGAVLVVGVIVAFVLYRQNAEEVAASEALSKASLSADERSGQRRRGRGVSEGGGGASELERRGAGAAAGGGQPLHRRQI